MSHSSLKFKSEDQAAVRSRSRQQWAQFLILLAGVGLLWLVVLPRIAAIPQMKAEIDFLEEKQIDPTAMFYSDLETIEETVQEITNFHKEHPDALW
ncbi:hypothetical protein [Gimesia sp.]|uniref:hypothetical protein n=1 Tax=Gimesia sp. TaxID=2024833 RepID=UPI000C693561|nr:hypothetical protein [Gimesia sp.]MAX37261.1 hypothetical protein [Gimesia sp.]HAH44009.1 hypothetical protein [Planctomycetaceae bacterium]HBL43201.1 hypothetical protein [Planctomycetaceae bacterium]